jgi:hypothetical protein
MRDWSLWWAVSCRVWVCGVKLWWLNSKQLHHGETVMTEQQVVTSRWDCDDWAASIYITVRLWWRSSKQLHHGETVVTEQLAVTSRCDCVDWAASSYITVRLCWLGNEQLHSGSDDMAKSVRRWITWYSSVQFARKGGTKSLLVTWITSSLWLMNTQPQKWSYRLNYRYWLSAQHYFVLLSSVHCVTWNATPFIFMARCNVSDNRRSMPNVFTIHKH